MRFVYALICLLLVAWAASAQERYVVTNKVPKYTVVNKTSCTCLYGGCQCASGVCQCVECGCGYICPGKGPNKSPVTVCQNGVCTVVSSPTQASGCASGSCSGQYSQPVSREGWYPGKRLRLILSK